MTVELLKHAGHLFVLLVVLIGCRQQSPQTIAKKKTPLDLIDYQQFRIDTLYDSNQIISMLTVNKSDLDELDFTILHHTTDLIPTSEFADKNHSLAAINGGFFDMENGGSICYLELMDTAFADTKDNDLFNGVIILNDSQELVIAPAQSDSFYQNSCNEDGVLVTGPLLILDGDKMELPERDLVTDRHPRTCICETKSAFLLMTIDGRTMEAAGMTLPELQNYLLHLDCIDAVNLDGGGSTTLWLNDKGVVNYPSDITGERPVSNVLAIVEQ